MHLGSKARSARGNARSRIICKQRLLEAKSRKNKTTATHVTRDQPKRAAQRGPRHRVRCSAHGAPVDVVGSHGLFFFLAMEKNKEVLSHYWSIFTKGFAITSTSMMDQSHSCAKGIGKAKASSAPDEEGGRCWEGWMQDPQAHDDFSRDYPMQSEDGIREVRRSACCSDHQIREGVRADNGQCANRDRAVAIAQPQVSSENAECICNCQVSRGMETVCGREDTRTKRTSRTKQLDLSSNMNEESLRKVYGE